MKSTLLVIDDERSILEILKYFFDKKYNVVSYTDGLEAFAWLSEGNLPKAIVADYKMPNMDGLTFVSQLRSNPLYDNIPIIILSGIESSNNKIKCLKEGADDYLVKPFNPEELDVRLDNILKRIEK
jgi:DNA-binding response OmpR family regulator